MIKKVSMVVVAMFALVACSYSKESLGTSLDFEYVTQSKDFDIVKYTDKDTGCKYLVANKSGYGMTSISMVQMRDKDDKPVCN